MARVKKIEDSKFETGKTVVICGKGESVEKVKNANLAGKYVACLNSATVFVENVDFLFVNDIEKLEILLGLEQSIEKILNITVPIQIHKNYSASKITYVEVLDLLKEYDMNLYTYCLHTQRMKNPETDEIDFFRFGPEAIQSVFHTSLFWLIEAGFRNFEIYGVGTSQKYSDVFVKANDFGYISGTMKNLPKSWHETNYQKGIQILKRNKCQYKFN